MYPYKSVGFIILFNIIPLSMLKSSQCFLLIDTWNKIFENVYFRMRATCLATCNWFYTLKECMQNKMEQLRSVTIDERLRLPTFRNIVVSTRLLGYLTVKMKAVGSFEMSGNVQPQALRHTPENFSLKQHRCENLKFLSAFSVTPGGLGSIWAYGLGLLQRSITSLIRSASLPFGNKQRTIRRINVT
jgi:hypothetical protein